MKEGTVLSHHTAVDFSTSSCHCDEVVDFPLCFTWKSASCSESRVTSHNRKFLPTRNIYRTITRCYRVLLDRVCNEKWQNMFWRRDGKEQMFVILTWAARRSGWWQRSGRRCWCSRWASPRPPGWWPGPAASARCWWGWSSGGSRGCPPALGQKAANTQTKMSLEAAGQIMQDNK